MGQFSDEVMDSISDEVKADAVLKALKDNRLFKSMMNVMMASSISASLGGDEGKFRCLIIAAERVEHDVDAAKYVRFIREARTQETIRNAAGIILDESERIVLSRFSEPDMERAILTVEVMEE